MLCQSSPPSVRYTAGLLHDIGRLGLLLAIGPRYSDALSIRYRDLTRANEIEMELFGITHCEAGAQLAQEWGLPDALRLCARHHHSETTTDVGELLHITQLACRLASASGFKEMAGVGAEQLNDVCLPENIPQKIRIRRGLAPRTRCGENSCHLGVMATSRPQARATDPRGPFSSGSPAPAGSSCWMCCICADTGAVRLELVETSI